MNRVLLADGAIDLRCCAWQQLDVDACDAVVQDPPFSKRTHGGQRHGRKDPRYCDPQVHPLLSSRGLSYEAIDADGAAEIAAHFGKLARSWMCNFTSHDLVTAYQAQVEADGRTTFQPVPCVQEYRQVRLAGDGPASWTDYLVVARPKSLKWRALDGAYVGPSFDAGMNALDRSKLPTAGGKPLWMMRKIIRDYTRAGDLVVDGFGGGFTTAIACALEGRRCISCEIDPETFAKGARRVKLALDGVDLASRQMSMLARQENQDVGRRQRRAKARDLFAGAAE
jgi:DNA methylase